MPLSSINIYTLKQIRTRHHRYDLEDYSITSPLICYKVLQYLLDLKSEPCRVELHLQLFKKSKALLKFGIISLSSRNKIIGIHIIGTGSLDQVYIEPREVFMAAMMKRMQACDTSNRSSRFTTIPVANLSPARMIFSFPVNSGTPGKSCVSNCWIM